MSDYNFAEAIQNMFSADPTAWAEEMDVVNGSGERDNAAARAYWRNMETSLQQATQMAVPSAQLGSQGNRPDGAIGPTSSASMADIINSDRVSEEQRGYLQQLLEAGDERGFATAYTAIVANRIAHYPLPPIRGVEQRELYPGERNEEFIRSKAPNITDEELARIVGDEPEFDGENFVIEEEFVYVGTASNIASALSTDIAGTEKSPTAALADIGGLTNANAYNRSRATTDRLSHDVDGIESDVPDAQSAAATLAETSVDINSGSSTRGWTQRDIRPGRAVVFNGEASEVLDGGLSLSNLERIVALSTSQETRDDGTVTHRTGMTRSFESTRIVRDQEDGIPEQPATPASATFVAAPPPPPPPASLYAPTTGLGLVEPRFRFGDAMAEIGLLYGDREPLNITNAGYEGNWAPNRVDSTDANVQRFRESEAWIKYNELAVNNGDVVGFVNIDGVRGNPEVFNNRVVYQGENAQDVFTVSGHVTIDPDKIQGEEASWLFGSWRFGRGDELVSLEVNADPSVTFANHHAWNTRHFQPAVNTFRENPTEANLQAVMVEFAYGNRYRGFDQVMNGERLIDPARDTMREVFALAEQEGIDTSNITLPGRGGNAVTYSDLTDTRSNAYQRIDIAAMLAANGRPEGALTMSDAEFVGEGAYPGTWYADKFNIDSVDEIPEEIRQNLGVYLTESWAANTRPLNRYEQNAHELSSIDNGEAYTRGVAAAANIIGDDARLTYLRDNILSQNLPETSLAGAVVIDQAIKRINRYQEYGYESQDAAIEAVSADIPGIGEAIRNAERGYQPYRDGILGAFSVVTDRNGNDRYSIANQRFETVTPLIAQMDLPTLREYMPADEMVPLMYELSRLDDHRLDALGAQTGNVVDDGLRAVAAAGFAQRTGRSPQEALAEGARVDIQREAETGLRVVEVGTETVTTIDATTGNETVEVNSNVVIGNVPDGTDPSRLVGTRALSDREISEYRGANTDLERAEEVILPAAARLAADRAMSDEGSPVSRYNADVMIGNALRENTPDANRNFVDTLVLTTRRDPSFMQEILGTREGRENRAKNGWRGGDVHAEIADIDDIDDAARLFARGLNDIERRGDWDRMNEFLAQAHIEGTPESVIMESAKQYAMNSQPNASTFMESIIIRADIGDDLEALGLAANGEINRELLTEELAQIAENDPALFASMIVASAIRQDGFLSEEIDDLPRDIRGDVNRLIRAVNDGDQELISRRTADLVNGLSKDPDRAEALQGLVGAIANGSDEEIYAMYEVGQLVDQLQTPITATLAEDMTDEFGFNTAGAENSVNVTYGEHGLTPLLPEAILIAISVGGGGGGGVITNGTAPPKPPIPGIG